MATTKSYRIRVHDAGTATPSDATVDFTLALSDLAEPPELPSPLIFPAEGRTEAQVWTFSVIDRAGAVSAHLADPASGRMWLLGRLVEVQDATDGGVWTSRGIGRLSDLSETGDPGLYEIRVEDERWVERNSEIFIAGGTSFVWPSGLKAPWRGFPASVNGGQITAFGGTFFGLNLDIKSIVINRKSGNGFNPALEFSETVRSWIAQDMEVEFDPNHATDEADVEKQRTLRLHIAGNDYVVVRFGEFSFDAPASPADSAAFDAPKLTILVSDPADALSSSIVGGFCYLHAPGAEPSEANPLHIGMDQVGGDGVSWGTSTGFIHPFALAKRIYDHIGARYDATAMQALIDDTSYAPIAPRITGKQNAAQWLEDHIYLPHQVVPFTDSEGRIAPKSVRLPTDIDTGTLFVFDASVVAEGGRPTFEHTSRDVINTLSVPGEQMRRAKYTGRSPDKDWNCDGMIVFDLERTVGTDDGGSEAVFGKRVAEIPLRGIKPAAEYSDDPEQQLIAAARYSDVIRQIKREIFEAFQDGPIRGSLSALRAAESVEAGDLVILDQDSLKGPNPGANARTGQRIVRILRKTLTVLGPRFEFLDVGPVLQPLAAPTLDIRQKVGDPTKLQVEISNVPAGAVVALQVGFGDTNPPVWSQTWTGLGACVIELAAPPSETTAWARAQASAPGRIRSIWAGDSVLTTVKPRVLAAAVEIGANGQATVSWGTNASTLGMRLTFAAHSEDADPPDPLTGTQDVGATAGSAVLTGLTVRPGETLTVDFTPYPGWTGAAVSGTAGDKVRRSATRAADESASAISNVHEVASPDPNFRRYAFDRGALVVEVFGAAVKFSTSSLSPANWATVAAAVAPLPAGQNYIDVPAPGPDEVSALQLEPRLADLSIPAGRYVVRLPVLPSVAHPPAVRSRVVLSADASQADVFATIVSEVLEACRLHVRVGGTTYSLVAGSADTTARYAASGTELGPTDWFYSGAGAPVQILNDLALIRDQISRIQLQGEGQKSGAKSVWIDVPLEVKGQPWVESVAFAFDEESDTLTLTGIGGARCLSGTLEISSSSTFATIAAASNVSMSDGGKVSLGYAVVAADRRKLWYGRLTPYNGALSGGSPTGLAGVAQVASFFLPAPPPAKIRFSQSAGATVVSTNLAITVSSDNNGGGTLSVWTNKAGTANPNPDGDADVSFVLGSTPATKGAGDSSSLNNIPVWPGRGKVIYARMVSTDGGDTGILPFTLHSWLDVIGADGKLIDGAIDRPAAFAASLRPPIVVSALPATNADSELVFLTTDRKLYRWNGSAWSVAVDAQDITINKLTGGQIEVGAIGTTQLAAKAATAAKVNVASVFVTGMSIVNGSPAGGFTWSACTVDFEENTYSVGIGSISSSAQIVWWRNESGYRTAFQTSAEGSLISDGYNQTRGDTIIAINDGGVARLVWNGTLIYGGQIITDGVKARHMASITMEVGKYIQSTGYVPGATGWKISGNGDVDFNNANFRGSLTLLITGSQKVEFVDGSGVPQARINGVTPGGAGGGGVSISGYRSGDPSGDTRGIIEITDTLITIFSDQVLSVQGEFQHTGTKIGFYSATAITKPTVTGSRGGNAALASALTALANLGLLTNSSTA